MKRDDFADAALVVLGHGTDQNAESAAPVYQHAAELRRRNIFAEVREAFWKQAPPIQSVLANLSAPRVFIVPLFISEGYFASEVIPRELGFEVQGSKFKVQSLPEGDRRLYYSSPVGSHDSMTGVILSRAREIVEKFPFPHAPRPAEITLFIAGHGTEKNENSRQPAERQVELIRALALYGGVHAIFLEESPRIPECYRLARTKNLVVVPFFISDGLHAQEDIPVLLGEARAAVRQRLAAGQATWRNPTEKNGQLVWYTPAIGSEPHLADVILERVREVVM
ncbi:MAG TPA: CbiX/SirB N-terminal domain-containing protein [Candidatus Sulfopaludibacter sp.]|nr:CbiX/SirB N-terminal domain-containing protein [Candidatus Sulfopaludibacter sp.]